MADYQTEGDWEDFQRAQHREPPEPLADDELLDRIDSWCDDADTGHEYVGRDLLYETWHLVEQTRRERDAAYACIAGGLVAFQLTREYVGGDVLPAIEGWSWFDWCQRAERLLHATEAAPGAEEDQ